MISDDRIEEIDSGIDKIRTEKPYDNHSDAIAALDWLAAAINDVRKAVNASEDTAAIARLQDRIETMDRLHSSVAASIKRMERKCQKGISNRRQRKWRRDPAHRTP